MSTSRATTKFRLAAAALGGAARAEPSFPAELRHHPIVVCVSLQPAEPNAPEGGMEDMARAAAAVRDAVSRERTVFRLADTPADADVLLTILRACRQPSLDFWDVMLAHASLIVNRTGQVLDAGADYVEARHWNGVGSTLVFLAKLQCAEHYEAIVRSRASDADPGSAPHDR